MKLTVFPHEYQMDAKDCGPACLKIIAKYYGKYYSLQYLRDLCGIAREGVSFHDISYAADKIGLRSISVTASIDELLFKLPLPCIAHWNDDHFIVVYKTSKSRIYVSDPAKGLISYTYEESKDKWCEKDKTCGMLMALSPMANFKQIKAHERIEIFRIYEDIIGCFNPYKKAFGIFFLHNITINKSPLFLIS